jgi:cytochrome c oxidase subunit 1
MSTAGASILALGYILPLIYLTWSLKYGKDAGPNPWKAMGMEWTVPSPPPKENFAKIPVVTQEPYSYHTMTPQGGDGPILPPAAPGERIQGGKIVTVEWSKQ